MAIRNVYHESRPHREFETPTESEFNSNRQWQTALIDSIYHYLDNWDHDCDTLDTIFESARCGFDLENQNVEEAFDVIHRISEPMLEGSTSDNTCDRLFAMFATNTATPELVVDLIYG
jgi:hypothetical protein